MRFNNNEWRVRFLFISMEYYLMSIHFVKTNAFCIAGSAESRGRKTIESTALLHGKKNLNICDENYFYYMSEI